MKIVQKRFLRESREFEIVEDTVNVRITSPLREKTSSVVLAILNPDPVVNGTCLEFHSRVKCDPLISLYLDRPDRESFDGFVEELKRRARAEYGAISGIRSGSRAAGLAGNVYEEPPDFDEPDRSAKKPKPVDVASIDSSIQMLERYLDSADIETLLEALRSLKADPQNEAHFDRLVTAFDNLGPSQGAVLTYAPYVNILLSDDPFEY